MFFHFHSGIGSVIRESCSSEPSTLTNYTDTMSISLLNSTIEKDQFKNKIIALLLNEMANGSSPYPNQMLSSPYGAQQQPIIVVQPPAQQIYFNQPPSYDRGYSYDSSQRSGQSKYLFKKEKKKQKNSFIRLRKMFYLLKCLNWCFYQNQAGKMLNRMNFVHLFERVYFSFSKC